MLAASALYSAKWFITNRLMRRPYGNATDLADSKRLLFTPLSGL